MKSRQLQKSIVDRVINSIIKRPFDDEEGDKAWFEAFSRAQPYALRRLRLENLGWPDWSRPLRIAFLSDLHVGSHSNDVHRLQMIVATLAIDQPDLVLYGGDFVNMQPFGGGRVPPYIIGRILENLRAPLGAFAVLGNHDYNYGAQEVLEALCSANITVLTDAKHQLRFEDLPFDLAGIPDCHVARPEAKALLSGLSSDLPTIVLAHDPACFSDLALGPHLMLAGHTHGGQLCIPGIGAFMNMSRAPLKHSYGLVKENGKQLYVTSGIGTSFLPVRAFMPPEVVLLEVGGAPVT